MLLSQVKQVKYRLLPKKFVRNNCGKCRCSRSRSAWIIIDFGRVDPDSDLGGENLPTKMEKVMKFHVFQLFSNFSLMAESFACSFNFLHGGLCLKIAISFLKKIGFFTVQNFTNLSTQHPGCGSGLVLHSDLNLLKMLDPYTDSHCHRQHWKGTCARKSLLTEKICNCLGLGVTNPRI